MLERGISTFVSKLPGMIGMYPKPSADTTSAPAYVSGEVPRIEIERAIWGTRQSAISLPVIVAIEFFPFINVTCTCTEIELPAKAITGESPVTAIAIGTSAGVGVLQTNSLCPESVIVDEIAATTGSSDVMRTANALAEILGANENSETLPELIFCELRPTGMKLPSEDKTSAVKFASMSEVERIRKVCVLKFFPPFLTI